MKLLNPLFVGSPMAKPFYLKYLIALVISVLYFLLQFHYMQQFLDWDQIGYTYNMMDTIKNNKLPVYNPHHLHMEAGGVLFDQFMNKYFGQYGFTNLVFNNRLKSLLAACIGIFFMVLFITDTTGKYIFGILGGMLTGFCHGYMVYAAKVDTGIFPAVAIILYLWCFQRIILAKKFVIPLSVISGVILFTGIICHQFMGIACIVFVVVLIIPSLILKALIHLRGFQIVKPADLPVIEKKPIKRYLVVLIVSLTAISLIVAAYFYAGKTVYDLPFNESETEAMIPRSFFGKVIFQKWLFGYANVNLWGNGIKKFNPWEPFRGYTDAFISPGKDIWKYNFESTFTYNLAVLQDKAALVPNIFAFFTIGVICLTLLLCSWLFIRYKRLFLFNTICIVFMFIFSTYWEPNYLEFWLVPCILMIVQAVLILNLLAEKLKPFLSNLAYTPFYILLFFFTAYMAAFNFNEHLLPYSSKQVLQTHGEPEQQERFKWLFSYSIYKHPFNPYIGILKEQKDQ